MITNYVKSLLLVCALLLGHNFVKTKEKLKGSPLNTGNILAQIDAATVPEKTWLLFKNSHTGLCLTWGNDKVLKQSICNKTNKAQHWMITKNEKREDRWIKIFSANGEFLENVEGSDSRSSKYATAALNDSPKQNFFAQKRRKGYSFTNQIGRKCLAPTEFGGNSRISQDNCCGKLLVMWKLINVNDKDDESKVIPNQAPEKPVIPDYYPDGYYEFKQNPAFPLLLGEGVHIRSQVDTQECVMYNSNPVPGNEHIYSTPCRNDFSYGVIINKVGVDTYTITFRNRKVADKKQYVLDLDGSLASAREYDPKRKTQLWKFIPRKGDLDEPYMFSIQSVETKKCLDTYIREKKLTEAPCSDSNAQGFWFAPAPKLIPIITDQWINFRFAADKIKCLYNNNGGSQFYFRPCIGNWPNSGFKVTKFGDDTYVIALQNDGKKNLVLDSGPSSQIYDPKRKTQLWRFIPKSEPEGGIGRFYIQNAATNNCLRWDPQGTQRFVEMPCLKVDNSMDQIQFLPYLKPVPVITNDDIRFRQAGSRQCIFYYREKGNNVLRVGECKSPSKFGFRLVKVGQDTYNIKFTEKAESDLVIDRGGVSNKYDSKSKTQQWKIVPHAVTGWFYIKNLASGECLKAMYSNPGGISTGPCDGMYNFDAYEIEVNNRVWAVLREPYYNW
jgi:hypothetical protein